MTGAKSKKKPAPKKRKTGRPSLYTEALAADICRRLAEGETLRSVCRDKAMPDKASRALVAGPLLCGVSATRQINGTDSSSGRRLRLEPDTCRFQSPRRLLSPQRSAWPVPGGGCHVVLQADKASRMIAKTNRVLTAFNSPWRVSPQ